MAYSVVISKTKTKVLPQPKESVTKDLSGIAKQKRDTSNYFALPEEKRVTYTKQQGMAIIQNRGR